MIKTGKVKGVRFATLLQICETCSICQPGDILEFSREAESDEPLGNVA